MSRLYKTLKSSLYFLLIAFPLYSFPALAFEKRDGCFIAAKECPALHSIRKQKNPDNAHLVIGQAYKLIGQNKPAPSHYQIRLPQRFSPARWVKTECGKVFDHCAAANENQKLPANDNAIKQGTNASTAQEQLVLAISWQPAFCETRQKLPECKTQTADRFDATHFSLHGLWPQPRNNAYCGVDIREKSVDRRKKWHLIPQLKLSEDTRTKLNKWMPGAMSYLHRHEWVKHGTCYKGRSAETYFNHSLMLLEKINISSFQKFMSAHIGQKLTRQKIRQAFETAFGPETGDRLEIKCTKKGDIQELRLNIGGPVSSDKSLKELLLAAPSRRPGCKAGHVDAAGFRSVGGRR